MLTPVKPCRSYTFITDASGVPVDVDPNFTNLGADPSNWNDWEISPEITLDELAELLQVFGRTVPDEIVASLSSHLDLIRRTVPEQDAVPDEYPARRLDDLLDKILKELPAAIRDDGALYAAYYQTRSFQKNQDLWLTHSEMKRFHRAALRFREIFREKLPPIYDKFQPWHDDAIYLAVLIDRWAIAEGFPMSWGSESSSGNNFIANGLYRVGIRLGKQGGKPTGDNVKQALKRHPSGSLLISKGTRVR